MSGPHFNLIMTYKFSEIINSILQIKTLRPERLSNLPKITASRARLLYQNLFCSGPNSYPLSSAEPSLAISTPGRVMRAWSYIWQNYDIGRPTVDPG